MKSFRAAWLTAALLFVSEPAAALVKQSRAPASAWWAAADLALERGDCARALEILERQVVDHHYGAVARLGDIHETRQCSELGLPAVPELYEGLIARGIDVAKARLGYLYLKGLGVPREVARAKRLFKAVLELVAHEFPEHRRAAMRGVMSRHGLPEELQAELDWADRIEAGPPRVQYEIALRLREGEGLPRHEDDAYDWLQGAAFKAVPGAWFELGIWELSRACDQDDHRMALGAIDRAAKLNYPPALKEMGLRMAEGRGVKRYDFGAMVLLLKAHWAGQDVVSTLFEVASRLNVHEKAVALEWAQQEDLSVMFGLAPSEAQPLPSASRSCSKSRISSWRR